MTLYIEYMENIYIKTILYSIIGSTTISTKMLHDSVKDIIQNPQQYKISS